MILPRYAAHIHVCGPKEVKITEMSSLSFETHRQMVTWFQEETGLATSSGSSDSSDLHLVASIHTPVTQVVRGIQQLLNLHELAGVEGSASPIAGFWIPEHTAIQLQLPSMPSIQQPASPVQVMEDLMAHGTSGTSHGSFLWSFLVALSALETLGDRPLGDHSMAGVTAAIGAAQLEGSSPGDPMRFDELSPEKLAKWDRSPAGWWGHWKLASCSGVMVEELRGNNLFPWTGTTLDISHASNIVGEFASGRLFCRKERV
eukprot:Skav235390  [mRNA]  locus=scaffold1262:466070:466846:- [translate_table: standard]